MAAESGSVPIEELLKDLDALRAAITKQVSTVAFPALRPWRAPPLQHSSPLPVHRRLACAVLWRVRGANWSASRPRPRAQVYLSAVYTRRFALRGGGTLLTLRSSPDCCQAGVVKQMKKDGRAKDEILAAVSRLKELRKALEESAVS